MDTVIYDYKMMQTPPPIPPTSSFIGLFPRGNPGQLFPHWFLLPPVLKQNCWVSVALQTMGWSCSCHPTKALKETKSTDTSQWPGLNLYQRTPKGGGIAPFMPASNTSITVMQTFMQQNLMQLTLQENQQGEHDIIHEELSL